MKLIAETFFVTRSDWTAARSSLFTEDGNENAGVFLCGVAQTRDGVRLLAREFVPVPFHHYVVRKSYHLEVSPVFYNEIVTRCERKNLHPVIIHSHPMAGDAWYSQSDDHGESRLLPILQSLLPGKTVASMVATWDVATGRRFVNSRFYSLSGMRILGPRIETSDFDAKPLAGAISDAKYDRQLRAFGESGQRQLGKLKVAVIGAGGTGSIIAEQLGRLGVGTIILVDDDTVEESNLNRVLGSSSKDIGNPKAEVLKNHLATFSRDTVEAINDSALKQTTLDKLTDCDLVFGCVDNDRTRATLNRFAYQYLIPFVDMGVRLDARTGKITAAAGRVSIVGAEMTCLRCSHHLSPERIRAESLPLADRERLANEGYVMGIEEPAPAVVTINTVIAGLAATGFLNLFTGVTGGLQPLGQIYDATSGSVFPVSQNHELGCDVCDPKVGVKALGDSQVVSAY